MLSFTWLFYVTEKQDFRSSGFYSCFSLESVASNTEGEEEKEEETALLHHMNTMKHGRKYIESHCLLLTENYARIEVGISYFVDVGNGRFQRTFLIFVFAVVFLNWFSYPCCLVLDIKHQIAKIDYHNLLRMLYFTLGPGWHCQPFQIELLPIYC